MTMTSSIYCTWNEMHHYKFISLGCISTSVESDGCPRQLSMSRKSEMLDKCFLCSKVLGNNQRNVGRSRNFDRFVSFNCNPRSGNEMSGSDVCPQVLTAEKKEIACSQPLTCFNAHSQMQTI